MAGNKIDVDQYNSGNRMQRIGLLLALVFYIVSVVMVVRNRYGADFFDPDMKTITVAHWQLEDGFREGMNVLIKRFEKIHAERGEKVRVIQSAIPTRTYKQWLQTQLISGDPADVIELNCSPNMLNLYFTPLSPYIGEPNPYNEGTPLAKVPWSDTYVDDMNSSLDLTFAEYFGISAFFFTTRMYVNLDLLERATGARKMPEDLTEWLAMCEQVKRLGEKEGSPLIPIGTRGIDRGTLGQLFSYYYQQMCGDLNDSISTYEASASIDDQLRAFLNGTFSREKALAANEIMQELGMYFSEGFSSIDLEQTKFLFSSGRVCFFPEGTWNAYSMVNNAKFKVGICPVPVLGKNHRFSKYYLGPPVEQGAGIGQAFGIAKATKHFDLALDFLHYMTSYEANQILVVEHAHWLSILKGVEYDTPRYDAETRRIMKMIQPKRGGGYQSIATPFSFGRARMLEIQEMAIINNSSDVGGEILNSFIETTPKLQHDIGETILTEKRNFNNIESLRTSIAFSMRANPDGKEVSRLQRQGRINFENLSARNRSLRNQNRLQKTIGEFRQKAH